MVFYKFTMDNTNINKKMAEEFLKRFKNKHGKKTKKEFEEYLNK